MNTNTYMTTSNNNNNNNNNTINSNKDIGGVGDVCEGRAVRHVVERQLLVPGRDLYIYIYIIISIIIIIITTIYYYISIKLLYYILLLLFLLLSSIIILHHGREEGHGVEEAGEPRGSASGISTHVCS